MIRRIQALNYRCLHYIDQSLKDFHVLVGPNASGKTTFLDTVSFLGDLLTEGLDRAISKRTEDFRDLLYGRRGDRFEIGVEMTIPDDRRRLLPKDGFEGVRYEIAIGYDQKLNEIKIIDEQVILFDRHPSIPVQRSLFPMPPNPPESIMSAKTVHPGKRVIRKVHEGNDNFYSEIHEKRGKGGWSPSFRLGPQRSALANLPEDERNFPVSIWLRGMLTQGVQTIMLNSMVLRKSAAPGRGLSFHPDGGNLPWVIHALRHDRPENFSFWIEHVRTALPDIQTIDTVELPDTRHRYLKIRYANGLDIPSWMASDGTLRLLALTLPAYLSAFKGIYLIEEPENGIHPQAMETVFQSLSSVYSAQLLVATHSPIVLGCAQVDDVLCFKKTDDGATDIVRGADHPALKSWKGEIPELSLLYASGVLG